MHREMTAPLGILRNIRDRAGSHLSGFDRAGIFDMGDQWLRSIVA